ncbi:hypothetical protein, partial [Paenibacillus xylanexedens]|uniref:hypothetical protein n=1 Tax=Paenibacillus xylanexedens TaxID=528191 RepID=UPI001C92FD72
MVSMVWVRWKGDGELIEVGGEGVLGREEVIRSGWVREGDWVEGCGENEYSNSGWDSDVEESDCVGGDGLAE